MIVPPNQKYPEPYRFTSYYGTDDIWFEPLFNILSKFSMPLEKARSSMEQILDKRESARATFSGEARKASYISANKHLYDLVDQVKWVDLDILVKSI